MGAWKYDKNDGRFPDGAAVLVKYPLDEHTDRDAWPWLPGTIAGQGGPDEWHVVVDGVPELAEPNPDDPDAPLYPACFRGASELRHQP